VLRFLDELPVFYSHIYTYRTLLTYVILQRINKIIFFILEFWGYFVSLSSLKFSGWSWYIVPSANAHKFYHIEPMSNVKILQNLQTHFSSGPQLNRLSKLDIISCSFCSLCSHFFNFWPQFRLITQRLCSLCWPGSPPRGRLCSLFEQRLHSPHSRVGTGQL